MLEVHSANDYARPSVNGRAGYVCAAVFALALGIGVNAAIFSGEWQPSGIYNMASKSQLSDDNQHRSSSANSDVDASPAKECASANAAQAAPTLCDSATTEPYFSARRMLVLRFLVNTKNCDYETRQSNQAAAIGP